MQKKRNVVRIMLELFQNCLFPKIMKIKIYKMKLQFCLLLFMFVKTVCHIVGQKWTMGVGEWGIENIWTREGGSNSRLRKLQTEEHCTSCHI